LTKTKPGREMRPGFFMDNEPRAAQSAARMKTQTPLISASLLLALICALAGCQTPASPEKSPPSTQNAAVSGKIYTLEETDVKPQIAGRRRTPVYPYKMWDARIPGEVILQFVVDSTGAVRDVEVVRSTHEAFETPAINAVKEWRFIPAQKDGKPVNCRRQIPINFTFNPDSR
jgi:TonB family protein